MPNESDHIDFSALDPTREAAFDAHVARIASDAMDARARSATTASAEPVGVLSILTVWARPTVLAAGILLAIALTAVVRSTAPSLPATAARDDEMLMPRSLAEILHSTTPPSVVELGVALSAASR